MTETITRSFVITPSEMEIIKDKAQKIGSLSDSAALRVIIREWAEQNVKQQPSPAPTTEQQ